jgi:hypothetical protein
MVDSMKKNTADIVGPVLVSGLSIKPLLSISSEHNTFYLSGAQVFFDGTEVFSVNETGRLLLNMADGSITVIEMVKRLGLEKDASDVGMFFVTLGQAGYLMNRVEIELYETHRYMEDGE